MIASHKLFSIAAAAGSAFTVAAAEPDAATTLTLTASATTQPLETKLPKP